MNCKKIKKGGKMENKKASVYNYLISNFDIDNKAVRIAIEAVCIMSASQEQDLIEQLAEYYHIDISEEA
jgi:hypothetical protein